MTGRRLHAAYQNAHGGSYVLGEDRSMLNSAISAAVRNRVLIEDAPLGEAGIRPRTYRLPAQPLARVRDVGPRSFEDVPPRELAQLMATMAEERVWHSNVDFQGAVLERLGCRTRLTSDVLKRLAEVARLIAPSGHVTTRREERAPRVPTQQQTPPGRPIRLSVRAKDRLAAEARWLDAWLADNHEVAGADRYAVQVERRQMNETRKRYVERRDELKKILELPVDPTYQPSRFVSPGAIVEVRHNDGPQVERVLITCWRDLPDGIESVSPFSALGHALADAEVGQTRTFSHGGRQRTVTVFAVRDS